jgi:hypothetical protein
MVALGPMDLDPRITDAVTLLVRGFDLNRVITHPGQLPRLG